jgi:hypothetical protein
MLADRIGVGRVFVALQLWRGLCFALYSLVSSFTGFVVLACGIGLAETAVPPLNQAVIGAAVPASHRLETMAKVRAVRNIGFGAGALVATATIHTGSRLGFLVLVLGDALSFLLAAALLSSIGIRRLQRQPTTARVARSIVADARYVVAALLSGLLSIHMTMLTLGLPLWIAFSTHVPAAMIGVLIMVNTAMTVALQVRFSASAEEVSGAVRCMLRAGVALAGFGLVAMALAHVESRAWGISLALVAVILLTCGELWHSAGSWTISYNLADPARRAQYLSTFQLGTALQTIIGPWVVTHLVLQTSVGWPAFAAATVAAGGLIGIAVPLHRPQAVGRAPL